MTSLVGIKHQKKRRDAGLQQMDQLRAGLSNAAEYCLLIFTQDASDIFCLTVLCFPYTRFLQIIQEKATGE